MADPKVFAMPFATVYPLYVAKAERKQRTRAEVDEIIRWLTGYDAKALRKQLDAGVDLKTFLDGSPRPHPKRGLVTGTVCGVRVEEIADPTMRLMRQLDKLVDELAKGRPMGKILRT